MYTRKNWISSISLGYIFLLYCWSFINFITKKNGTRKKIGIHEIFTTSLKLIFFFLSRLLVLSLFLHLYPHLHKEKKRKNVRRKKETWQVCRYLSETIFITFCLVILAPSKNISFISLSRYVLYLWGMHEAE